MAKNTLGAESARVTDAPTKPNIRSATQSLIRACSDPAVEPGDAWKALQHHRCAAEILGNSFHPDYDPDELAAAADDLEVALMGMPSPDVAALRWKLDYFLDPIGGGSTDSYPTDFVAQTVADYRRMLGDA